LFCDVEEVVDDVLRRALEALAQYRVLRGYSYGAGVEMALAHHDAAGRNQWSRREAKLVCTQKRTDDHIASRTQATIDLERDPRAQAVENGRLVRLGKTHSPWAAGMLQRSQRRSTGAAIIAGHGNVVGTRLGDARRN